MTYQDHIMINSNTNSSKHSYDHTKDDNNNQYNNHDSNDTQSLLQSPVKHAINVTSIHSNHNSNNYNNPLTLDSASVQAATTINNATTSFFTKHTQLFTILCLILLTTQNIAITIVLRYSRGILKERYLVSSSVLIGEITKFIISIIVLCIYYENYNIIRTIQRIKTQMQLHKSLPLIVPALCYFAQNMLSGKALDYLDAFTFQSLQQLRLLTTAAFSIILLGKTVSLTQWRALALLLIGLSLVLWRPAQPTVSNSNNDISPIQYSSGYIIGICMVLSHSVSSGFAGVYFEAVLKSQGSSINVVQRFFYYVATSIENLLGINRNNHNNNKNSSDHTTNNKNSNIQQQVNDTVTSSLWDRNIQLASYSIIVGILILLCNVGGDLTFILEHGYFYNWSYTTVIAMLLQSVGGLLIALVVQFTDNIIKGFALSISLMLTPAVTAYLFNETPYIYPNIAGVLVIVISCFNYNM